MIIAHTNSWITLIYFIVINRLLIHNSMSIIPNTVYKDRLIWAIELQNRIFLTNIWHVDSLTIWSVTAPTLKTVMW